jgi:hypothetical protein
LKQQNSGEKGVEAILFMAPLEICLDSSTDFESRRIPNSRKFWSKILFTPKLGACVDTVFCKITGQKGQGGAADEMAVQSAD